MTLTRYEIERQEANDEKYWLKRLEHGTYPCDKCGDWGSVRVCEKCEDKCEDKDECRHNQKYYEKVNLK